MTPACWRRGTAGTHAVEVLAIARTGQLGLTKGRATEGCGEDRRGKYTSSTMHCRLLKSVTRCRSMTQGRSNSHRFPIKTGHSDRTVWAGFQHAHTSDFGCSTTDTRLGSIRSRGQDYRVEGINRAMHTSRSGKDSAKTALGSHQGVLKIRVFALMQRGQMHVLLVHDEPFPASVYEREIVKIAISKHRAVHPGDRDGAGDVEAEQGEVARFAA